MEDERVCKDCGKPFIPKIETQVYCCKACYERKKNRAHGRKHKKKRNKMARDRRVNPESVSLAAVYERAQGRCWICGRKCSFDDYKIIEGREYCGPSYPTRDHVRPIREGGKTNFDNVLLACWECNNRKGGECTHTTFYLAESFRREVKYMQSHPGYKFSLDVDEYPDLEGIEF